MNYRIVIGGCRNYTDYTLFKTTVDFYLLNLAKDHDITVLSGHCSGVDMMAEQYAKEKGYHLEIYPADWQKYGKSAGPIRNEFMVEKSDFVIAFWDRCSKGTKSLICIAKKLKKPLRIKYIAKR